MQLEKKTALGGAIQISEGGAVVATFANSSIGHRLYSRFIDGLGSTDSLYDSDAQRYIVGDVGELAP